MVFKFSKVKLCFHHNYIEIQHPKISSDYYICIPCTIYEWVYNSHIRQDLVYLVDNYPLKISFNPKNTFPKEYQSYILESFGIKPSLNKRYIILLCILELLLCLKLYLSHQKVINSQKYLQSYHHRIAIYKQKNQKMLSILKALGRFPIMFKNIKITNKNITFKGSTTLKHLAPLKKDLNSFSKKFENYHIQTFEFNPQKKSLTVILDSN